MSVHPAPGECEGGDSPAEAILADALERLLAGEEIDLYSLPGEHPEHAAEIQRRLPGIRMLLQTEPPPRKPRSRRRGPAIPAGYDLQGILGRGDRGLLILRKEDGPGRLARFLDVDHTGLLKVYPLDRDGLLVERLEGPSLGGFLDAGEPAGSHAVSSISAHLGLSEDPYGGIARAFATLASGLAALHEREFVHGSLYPGAVRAVIGRGLVLVEPGVCHAAIPFQAPEILGDAAASPDPRTDVYGLGAALSSILTNRPPGEGRDAPSILAGMREQWPPDVRTLNPEVPERLAKVVAGAMAFDPADRPVSMETFGTSCRAC